VLLIADEPTTALDVTTEAQILTLMRELQGETGTAIMYITHNLAVVAEIAHDVMVMYMGKDVEYASVDSIFHDPRHPYTVALLDSIPRIDMDKDMLAVLPGRKCPTSRWRRGTASVVTCIRQRRHAHDPANPPPAGPGRRYLARGA
jgi:oligopeptide/dipeptide ABC transporter ATP-binding protein